MSEWSRDFMELALALKREEINDALQYRQKYDAEDHNLCLALVRYRDGGEDILYAYSNSNKRVLPESRRIGLNLIPDLSGAVPVAGRFGCDGMAQHHTEPKLLNYLCATPSIRRSAYEDPLLPHTPFYRSVVKKQRKQALRNPQLLRRPEEMVSVTLVTEIDCCTMCRKYAIERFRTRYREIFLDVVQLGKSVRDKRPPNYKKVVITRTP